MFLHVVRPRFTNNDLFTTKHKTGITLSTAQKTAVVKYYRGWEKPQILLLIQSTSVTQATRLQRLSPDQHLPSVHPYETSHYSYNQHPLPRQHAFNVSHLTSISPRFIPTKPPTFLPRPFHTLPVPVSTS
ncbi:hypothetical protein QE152_g32014 [Popillia japonica]|uniref:Uncharacterized protein n=1 Tax=Popillia japonica TaxID=7064 RepID=A0AAW1J0A5_POPJA